MKTVQFLFMLIACVLGSIFQGHFLKPSVAQASTPEVVMPRVYTLPSLEMKQFNLDIDLATQDVRLTGTTPNEVNVNIKTDTVVVPVITKVKERIIVKEFVELNPRPRWKDNVFTRPIKAEMPILAIREPQGSAERFN